MLASGSDVMSPQSVVDIQDGEKFLDPGLVDPPLANSRGRILSFPALVDQGAPIPGLRKGWHQPGHCDAADSLPHGDLAIPKVAL